ncbi:uncharacterized protein FFUJ_08075 [Fusarium fujikuroi IMI 58289]|uniref:Uncharacterized protein n=1 Tax=Gibberella fujikuroi (strain CBS 195.34 / IMI 58289 / NRRL A-6831) TaxID=1279085 RepID=S0EA75_GIBF5|nr:uncharacterized protein FFUJ_08075 [Fusarium fujikuroi IMI 58289]KLP09031.1 uncharacterized protein Y057_3307 [Fusarium fujikuroi]KLP10969.1 uncharacterized protein LW94_598 [Fusarium fujikuroi]CCT71816.1 uncharacterized protein FFUJ_08075 [Fusarium fujikuroi IMI 58289]SCO20907.1 uncharacterized protein FFM5_12550 [Fusarium fujikuroi]SCO22450.1 uncharacterized protein FFC1_14390 [Fusarium fujikuroi]
MRFRITSLCLKSTEVWRSVPEDYLAKIFAIYRGGPSTRLALVEAGCTAAEGIRASISPLRFHLPFSQFTRNQPWSEEDMTSSWHRAAAYYHDRSIDWIKIGLNSPTTPKSKPKDEWENLTAVLSHRIPELDNDTEVSTCPRTSAPLPISGENAHLKKAGFYFGPERHVAEPPKPCEDTLLDAFDALNSASINQEQDLPPLDQSLRDAMQRLRGTNIDEVGILEKHQWMTTRRMQCLKGLDRESESKAQILELKNIASRREDLWTSQDRQKEKYQNLTAMMERRMGGLSSSTRVGDIDTRLTSTTMVGASTGSPSRHRAEEEDLENLYLINKPWMRKVDELLNALGGIRVEEYYDFEIPPSRIGGLFLYRSRVFMANGFLEMLGVAK